MKVGCCQCEKPDSNVVSVGLYFILVLILLVGSSLEFVTIRCCARLCLEMQFEHMQVIECAFQHGSDPNMFVNDDRVVFLLGRAVYMEFNT